MEEFNEKLAKKELMRDITQKLREAAAEDYIIPEIVFEILESVAQEHGL